MASIYPFRGFRFNEEKIGSISDVVTQPYDKISEEMRQRYLKKHPNNIVRIIKNSDYGAASQFFADWIREGVLERDLEPSLYIHEQEFVFEQQSISRIGFIGLVDLSGSEDSVKGHERVLDKPLSDRLNLIRATEANDGLIFTLFSDPSRRVDALLSDHTSNHLPDFDFVDDLGVVNRLWKATDQDLIVEIQNCVKDKALYIADGHHRFTTAVKFFEECTEKGWRPAAPESFDKRMVAMFNMDGEGVRILATHRALKNLEGLERTELFDLLGKYFSLRRCPDFKSLANAVESSRNHAVGLILSDPIDLSLLTLKENSLDDSNFMGEIEGAARELDVNILHEGILRPFLGIGGEELASGRYVEYYRDKGEMFDRLKEGKYQLAFLLRPTSLEQVRVISEMGRKMPQKSTDFYPKILTGLVLMKMEIDK